MRIWIDIENPPQVQYLSPFKRSFEKTGHDVTVTAMDNSITLDLLEQRGVTPNVIGSQMRTSRSRKIARVLSRTLALGRHVVAGRRPDILVATSRSAVLAAWALQIPSFTFCDYEHVDLRVLRLTRAYVFHPDVIEPSAFTRHGIRADRLLPMDVLKEAISFSGIDFSEVAPHPLPVDRSLVRVLFRPAGEETHYFVPESRQLAFELLEWLADREDMVVIFSPRYDHQLRYLEGLSWRNDPIVLESGIPFAELLKAVDIVVSSGGTMLREAAFLGVPAYSIFRSEIGQVDRHLERIGRLVILDTPSSFARIDTSRTRSEPLTTRTDVVAELAERMVTHARPRRSRRRSRRSTR